MTWNIQNGGVIRFDNDHTGNIQNILDTIKTVNPDVAVLQEYQNKYHEELVESGLKKLSYSCTVCEDSPDASLRNRVLIASKLPFLTCERPSDLFKYSRRNWNEVRILPKTVNMRILGVHVPLATTNIHGNRRDNTREKEEFLKALKGKALAYQCSDEPAVILGDFNLHSEAVYQEYLDEFSRSLEEITSKDSTWGNHKFDYIFANRAFVQMLDKSKVYAPHFTEFSDHKYLFVDIALK